MLIKKDSLRIVCVSTVILCCMVFAACSTGTTVGDAAVVSANTGGMSNIDAGTKKSEKRDGLLGTVISITAYGDSAESAIDEAFDIVRNVDEKMSANDPNSEISKLNEAQNAESLIVSEETYGLLETALHISEISDGAFDPSIGGVTALWKTDGAFSRLPAASEISAALPGVGIDKILLQGDGEVRLNSPLTKIDLGGIAKGYACDRATECLRERGVKAALLDFGGNIYALGSKPAVSGADAAIPPEQDGWSIGIAVPYPGDNGIACSFIAKDTSVVTSGSYQRFFEKDGTVYHHILDPRTGYPAVGDLLSVSIVAPVSAEADGLSTACFVLGLERGMALLESVSGVEGLFITADNVIHTTSGLKGVTLHDERFTIEEA